MEEKLEAYVLLLTNEAKQDILEIANWYESKRSGLGDEFMLSLEATFAHVSRNPKLFQLHQIGVRCAFTKRFPYRVVFEIDGNMIVVYSIVHTSRNPTVWQSVYD